MKKLISAVCAGILCLLFAGCTNENKADVDTETNSTESLNLYYPDGVSAAIANLNNVHKIPHTLTYNNVSYNLLPNNIKVKPDRVIGHVIKQNYLETYNLLYPNLLPLICDTLIDVYSGISVIDVYSVEGDTNSEYIAVDISNNAKWFLLYSSN